MAEPDKQQLGDGHDNYGHAAQQAAKAAKQATKAAAAKGAEAAAKGAEATANAAAATVQAGVQAGGSAVSEVAVGTASGGPWGAIIAAAWSMRSSMVRCTSGWMMPSSARRWGGLLNTMSPSARRFS